MRPVGGPSEDKAEQRRGDRISLGPASGDSGGLRAVCGRLREFFGMVRAGRWRRAARASTFHLGSSRLRPEGWTSVGVVGLPVFPAVVRHDELQRGVIRHPLRGMARRTLKDCVAPARHLASREGARICRGWGGGSARPRFRDGSYRPRGARNVRPDNGIDLAISVTPEERTPTLMRSTGGWGLGFRGGVAPFMTRGMARRAASSRRGPDAPG